MKPEQLQDTLMETNSKPTKKRYQKPYDVIHMQVSTWTKQSHGLFDYQSQPSKIVKEDPFIICNSSRVYRGPNSKRTYVRSHKQDQQQIQKDKKVQNAENSEKQIKENKPLEKDQNQNENQNSQKVFKIDNKKTKTAQIAPYGLQALEGYAIFSIQRCPKTRKYNLIGHVKQAIEQPNTPQSTALVSNNDYTQKVPQDDKIAEQSQPSRIRHCFHHHEPIQGKLFRALTPVSGHALFPGDYFKLGRVEFRVIEFKTETQTLSMDYEQTYGAKQYIFEMKGLLQGQCKICLGEESFEQDPLINPCNCKGHCGVIHLDCLKTWINNKVKKEMLGSVTTYNFHKFTCEICQAPFPSTVRLENRAQYGMLDFEKPTSSYLMVQQCCQTQKMQAKTIHFITPKKGMDVKLGRAMTCQLNITDISVSRVHAKITFDEKEFRLYDSSSKFGTLLQIRQPVQIVEQVRVQFEGCYFQLNPAWATRRASVKQRSVRKSPTKQSAMKDQ